MGFNAFHMDYEFQDELCVNMRLRESQDWSMRIGRMEGLVFPIEKKNGRFEDLLFHAYAFRILAFYSRKRANFEYL